MQVSGNNVPKFETDGRGPVTILLKDDMFKAFGHRFDPFGVALCGLKQSIELYKYNVPDAIISYIISYLEYTESTLHLSLEKGMTSNPTKSYGTECIIFIATPKQTLLPSNCYILSRLQYQMKTPEGLQEKLEIYAGIQEFDKNDIYAPGEGNVLYGKSFKLDKGTIDLDIEPNLQLECGKVYMFWIMVTNGHWWGALADSRKTESIETAKNLKLTNPIGAYYINRYKLRNDVYKVYEVEFTPKI